MQIACDTSIPFPRALVFETYRDHLLSLVPYLPNVHQIDLKSRREIQAQVFCINHWHGGGDIPVIARSFISKEMLSWTEHNIWDAETYTLTWRIDTHAFTKAVHCAGENQFIAQGNSTVVQNRGELKIIPQNLDSIPAPLRPQVAKIVEEFLGQKVTPNLLQMGAGVRRYLEHTQTQH